MRIAYIVLREDFYSKTRRARDGIRRAEFFVLTGIADYFLG